MFVKYIQQETGTRVQIKGQGSGFVDQETGKESEELMHIHITWVLILARLKLFRLTASSEALKTIKSHAQKR